MRALRPAFTAAADTLVDDLVARGTFDAIRELAEAYPLAVFPDAVGIPPENRRFLLPYGNMVFNSFGPRNALFEAAVADAAPVLAWVQAQSRRDALTGTGFGAAIHAAADRGEVSEAEAEVLVRSLLTAGVDTTVNALGAAVYCLARFPDAFAALRADPGLARAAFEEAIRLESPVQTFFRTTVRDVTVAARRSGRRRKVLMFLGAANRDPRRWERPGPVRPRPPRGRACGLRHRDPRLRRRGPRPPGRRGRARRPRPEGGIDRDRGTRWSGATTTRCAG